MKLAKTTPVAAVVLKDRVVQRLTEAERALSQAAGIDQVRLVMDVAAAQEVFAKRQQLGETVIGYAHAIKVHALAKLGELLKELPKARGGQPYQTSKSTGSQPEPVARATLADLGIDKKTSMVAQQLADLPAETREAIAQRETTLTKVRRVRNDVCPIATDSPTENVVLNAINDDEYIDPWREDVALENAREGIRKVAREWPDNVSRASLARVVRDEADRIDRMDQQTSHKRAS